MKTIEQVLGKDLFEKIQKENEDSFRLIHLSDLLGITKINEEIPS